MIEAYQFGAVDGYYAGPLALPDNCTMVVPEIKEGFIPWWNGQAWEQVENHVGKSGYLHGQPHTISEYGTLPEGWSDTPPPPTTEEKAAAVRAQRTALLAETDHKIVEDYPLTDAAKEALKEYRQALRDITAQEGFPDVVVWPDNPI